jgi:hypothetical protein
MKNFDFFFSYSHKDSDFVNAVKHIVVSNKGKVWIDDTQANPGDYLPAKINSGFNESFCLVLFHSASYQESNWANAELNAAISSSIQENRLLIVVTLDATPLPPLLASKLYIDAIQNKTPEYVADELLKAKNNWYPSAKVNTPEEELTTVSIDDVTSMMVENIARNLVETIKGKSNTNDLNDISFDILERERDDLRCYVSMSAVNKYDILSDLESQLNIRESNKKHVRLLKEKIAKGGLGVDEPSYIIQVESKEKTLNDNIQEIRDLLRLVITRITPITPSVQFDASLLPESISQHNSSDELQKTVNLPIKPFSPMVEKTISSSQYFRDTIMYFDEKFRNAFPGVRGTVWFDSKTAMERLSIFFEDLTHKECNHDGWIWWFREGDDSIEQFRCTEGMMQLNIYTYKVKRLAAVDSGAYYHKFLYVECEPSEPTNFFIPPSESLMGTKKHYTNEEFAVFGQRVIPSAEYDDGVAVIDGNPVKLHGKAEPRIHYVTPYNFVIAPHGSPINNNNFRYGKGVEIMDELLDNYSVEGNPDIKLLVQEICRLPGILFY